LKQRRKVQAAWEVKQPSVTTALARYVDLQHIPPERLQLATARGTKIHDYIFMDLAELWVPPALITPEIEGYWNSYLIFKNTMIEKTILIEERLTCTCYGYTGILDWCGILRGENGLTVIDWKSPVTEGKTWRSQVAAYWHLVEKHSDILSRFEIRHLLMIDESTPDGLPLKRCGALMLSPKGVTPTFKEYTEFQPDYFNDFLLALGAYQAFV